MSQVLIVDDDPDIRDTLCEVLRDEGYEVDTAGDGQQALDYLKTRPPPCVILLDLMMPVMSGPELLEAQRRDPALAHVPVVLVSAARNLSALADEIDDVDFLAKPIQLDDLFDTVSRYCPAP